MGFSPLVQKQMLVILGFRMIDKFTKCSVLIDGLWLKVVCQNILNISGFFGFLCVLLFFIFLGCLLLCFLLLFILLSCLFEQLEESCCFVAIQNNIGQLEQDWSWNWDLIYFYFRLHPFSEKKRLLQTFTFYMWSFTFYRQEFTTLFISWKGTSYINIKRQNTQTKNIWGLRGNI